MLHLITPNTYSMFGAQLAEMHRLRYRVFKLRLDWDVAVSDGSETDGFDALRPQYIVQRDPDGQVSGCVRLLPTTGPTMLRDTFPALLHGTELPEDASVWESSRFALEASDNGPTGKGRISVATYELFAGVVEFCLAMSVHKIVTVTDIRVERILRIANWPLRSIGPALQIGKTLAIAGYLDVSHEILQSLLDAGGLKAPVLWAPVASSPIVA